MNRFSLRTLDVPSLAWIAVLVMVVMVNQMSAQGSPPFRVLVPELRIDGEANDIVSALSLVAAPNGNVIVLGRDEYRGKVFGPDGKLIRNFGRNGRGPGEISSSVLQQAGMVGDTLWLHDGGAARIALFSSNGEPLQDIPFRRGASSWQEGRPEWAWLAPSLAPMRLLSGGVAITVPHVGLEAVRTADTMGREQPLIRTTWSGELIGSPLALPVQDHFFRLKPPLTNGRSFQQSLAHFPKYAISGDGRRLVLASVRDAERPFVELLHLSTEGDTITINRVPFSPDPIRGRSVDSVIANWLSPSTGRPIPGYAQRYAGAEAELRDSLIVPRYHSPFRGVMLRNDGTTWLRWHVPNADPQWLVVSARGEVLMQVMPPKDVTILEIEGAIWGMSRDDVGFLSLIRFAVREAR